MKILINCSNLKKGGGVQVADSFCRQLHRYPHHQFYVVFSTYMNDVKLRVEENPTIACFTYEIRTNFRSVILGRDSFLDDLVKQFKIDVVFTVFGPSRWHPKVPHLSGFAMSQLVIPESPFFTRMGRKERINWGLWKVIRVWSFKKTVDCLWTENPYISARLKLLMIDIPVFTISNYYNQIYDNPSQWGHRCKLPEFKGITCLSISTPFPHKNLEIIPDVLRCLGVSHPELKVRFVLTCRLDELAIPVDVLDNVFFIGKVDVPECPYLYEQSDIMFMPTLLECFSATYPEAMRMEVPIVTTDLEFAHGLCGDAACYYSAVDPQAAAEAIYKVATDKEYAAQLVANGKEQLKRFDNYEQRANKLIKILEDIASEQK